MNIPLIQTFKTYSLKKFRRDILAAFVVTAIAIPESMAFAAIAGLPVENGLYCALLAPIVFALFASTKRLVIGADSATAVIIAGGVAVIATAGTAEYANAVVVLGLITGAVLVVMGLFRMGFFADLISRPVLTGFLAGVGLQLIFGRLPEMLGLELQGSIVSKTLSVLTHISSIHLATIALSIGVLIAVYAGGCLKLPGPLIGLVVGIGASVMLGLESVGVKVVGEIPSGLPNFVWPEFSTSLVLTLIPTALSVAIVILAQSSAVARAYAAKHEESTRDSQDLIALGSANFASALTGGFIVNGSPPRTAAAEKSGGSSQMVNVMMAVMIGLLLIFLTGLVRYIPVAALAAIVFAIGIHLIDINSFINIYKTRRNEFYIAILAMICVALLGVRIGVLFAVIASLVERLHRQYHPADVVLLKDRHLDPIAKQRLHSHHDFTNHPSGIIVYQFKGSLFFENIGYFTERLTAVIKSAKEPVHYVVIDAESINDLDYTAAEAIKQLIQRLSTDEIQLAFAHVHPVLKRQLDKYSLTDIIGEQYIYPTLNDAFSHLASVRHSAKDMINWLELPANQYVVIGGAAMELMGIRRTNDVDIVVSRDIYEHYNRKKRWKEFVQDDGKRTLWHHGYVLMTTWMGKDLNYFQKTSQTTDGIPVIGVRQLIELKTLLNRRKDKHDIELLAKYITKHHKSS